MNNEEYKLIRVEHLEDDEVDYELRIRHMCGVHSVSERRKRLRIVLRESDPEISVLLRTLNSEQLIEELRLCTQKTESILTELESEVDQERLSVCRSRLVHLRKRIYRSIIQGGEQQEYFNKLYTAANNSFVFVCSKINCVEQGNSVPSTSTHITPGYDDDPLNVALAQSVNNTQSISYVDRESQANATGLSDTLTDDQVSHSTCMFNSATDRQSVNDSSQALGSDNTITTKSTETIATHTNTQNHRRSQVQFNLPHDNTTATNSQVQFNLPHSNTTATNSQVQFNLPHGNTTATNSQFNVNPIDVNSVFERAASLYNTYGSAHGNTVHNRASNNNLSQCGSAMSSMANEYGNDLARIQNSFGARSRGLPVHAWSGVKFNGDPKLFSRFLVRVKQFAEAESTSEDELFRCRVHLFEGDAADWLSTRPDIRTWNDLVTQLSSYIGNGATDFDKLNDLRKWRQGTEPTNAFITKMELFFNEFRSPLDETVKVDLVLRGLRPSIRDLLAANSQIVSVESLRVAACRLEKVMQAFSPPTSGQRVQQAPNILPSKFKQAPGPLNNHNNAASNFQFRDPALAKQTCFGCGATDHWKNECPKFACWGCGRFNTRKSNCPNCQGN